MYSDCANMRGKFWWMVWGSSAWTMTTCHAGRETVRITGSRDHSGTSCKRRHGIAHDGDSTLSPSDRFVSYCVRWMSENGCLHHQGVLNAPALEEDTMIKYTIRRRQSWSNSWSMLRTRYGAISVSNVSRWAEKTWRRVIIASRLRTQREVARENVLRQTKESLGLYNVLRIRIVYLNTITCAFNIICLCTTHYHIKLSVEIYKTFSKSTSKRRVGGSLEDLEDRFSHKIVLK